MKPLLIIIWMLALLSLSSSVTAGFLDWFSPKPKAAIDTPPPIVPKPKPKPVVEVPKPIEHNKDVRVVDGDTVEFKGNNWRLMGFDAPETFQPKCEEERALGLKTKARLQALLDSKPWQLIKSKGKDKYGRVLGRLMIDGEDVADILVGEGLAHRYDGRAKRQPWCGGKA